MQRGRWLYAAMTVVVLLHAPFSAAFAAGSAEAESGRTLTSDIVASGGLVSAATLDAEAVLDDYAFEHSIPDGTAAEVFVRTDHPLVYVWGGEVTVQASIATNRSDFFGPQPFDYVLFFNDPGVLDEEGTIATLAGALGEIVRRAADGQRLFVYLRADEAVSEVKSAASARSILEAAARQERAGLPHHAVEAMIRTAEEQLDGRPLKLLWILGRPLTRGAYGFDGVATVLSALRSPGMEVSYCGYRDALVPQAVNQLVRTYGGNSYYITESETLPDIIGRDFDYFARPAIADVRIRTYLLGAQPSGTPIRTLEVQSMGPDEHHSLLAQVTVPGLTIRDGQVVPFEPDDTNDRAAARYAEGYYVPSGTGASARGGTELALPVPTGFAARLPTEQPILLVTWEYVDARDDSTHRGAQVVTVSYTAEYEQAVDTTNYEVVKSWEIVQTYTLISQIATFIQYRRFDSAIQQLDAQARTLRELLRHVDDDMIAEDLVLIETYKRRLLELKRDPDRASVILEEL